MLNKLKTYFSGSDFFKNVLTLMTGTVIAQAIPFLISPIVTRLFSPEDFAILALYSAVAGAISVVATGRYELAVMIPTLKKDAINLVGAALSITIILSILSLLSFIFFNHFFTNLLGNQDISIWLYFIPGSVFFGGIFQTLLVWQNREKEYVSISKSRISQTLSSSIGQLISGFSKLSGGLILSNILGQLISSTYLIYRFISTSFKDLSLINRATMKKMMYKHRDFPLVNSFHVLSDVLKNSISVVLISLFFGDITLGLYAFSLRILQAPLGIIGSSFGQVLFQKMNENVNQGISILPMVKKNMKLMFLLGLPVFTILYFFSPWIFALIFGEEWRVAGEYTSLLIPFLFTGFIISPISHIPIIFGKQKLYFYISLLANISFVAVFYFLNSLGIENILLIISALMSSFNIFYMFWYIRIVKKQIRSKI